MNSTQHARPVTRRSLLRLGWHRRSRSSSPWPPAAKRHPNRNPPRSRGNPRLPGRQPCRSTAGHARNARRPHRPPRAAAPKPDASTAPSTSPNSPPGHVLNYYLDEMPALGWKELSRSELTARGGELEYESPNGTQHLLIKVDRRARDTSSAVLELTTTRAKHSSQPASSGRRYFRHRRRCAPFAPSCGILRTPPRQRLANVRTTRSSPSPRAEPVPICESGFLPSSAERVGVRGLPGNQPPR